VSLEMPPECRIGWSTCRPTGSRAVFAGSPVNRGDVKRGDREDTP
jgi:hypothetical protein